MKWPWRHKSERLPRAETREAVREAAEIRQKAELRLRVTQARTPVIESIGARLEEQLHNKNHIGRLFDHAIKGTK